MLLQTSGYGIASETREVARARLAFGRDRTLSGVEHCLGSKARTVDLEEGPATQPRRVALATAARRLCVRR